MHDISSSNGFNSPSFVGAIDQGTTSSRFIIFDQYARIVASHQLEFPQIFPTLGQVEHRLPDILSSVETCVEEACRQFTRQGHSLSTIKAIGIANQRESACCWSRSTGEPLFNCLVWPDRRNTATLRRLEKLPGVEDVKRITGLRMSTYFAATKLRWMLDHVPTVRTAHDTGDLMFGTVDSWLVYNLTGGKQHGGQFVTDVTNASRTMLMDLSSLEWSQTAMDFFGVRRECLADRIVSNAEQVGSFAKGPLKGTPITSMVGDQHAALIGQKCLSEGMSKSTYGTGCFLLYHTGSRPVESKHGLLTTIAYKSSPETQPNFALEGSVSSGGSSVKWVRDQLGLVQKASQVGEMASQVEHTEGLYFVTAFDGLLAPVWDDRATGMMIGLTHKTTKNHIARATLEATCYQAKAVLDAMATDSGYTVKALRVDGGLTNSDACMQIQADLSGILVERPAMKESTALGAAICAGSAIKLFGWDMEKPETLSRVNNEGMTVFEPRLDAETRARGLRGWNKAVERAREWNDVHEEEKVE